MTKGKADHYRMRANIARSKGDYISAGILENQAKDAEQRNQTASSDEDHIPIYVSGDDFLKLMLWIAAGGVGMIALVIILLLAGQSL